MAGTKLNPFRYGHPVPPEYFIGRERAIKTIFSRINNGESTALVGDPHIGKSSLLRYIASQEVRARWLDETAGNYGFVEIDIHMIPNSYRPADFWRQVLDQIEDVFRSENIRLQIEVARQSIFGSFTLKRLFDLLAREDRCVVLLIDEFDTLLNHANFNTAEFFGALRSLSTLTEGLVVVTASRMSIAEMNRRGQEINPLGSPFFNAPIEVRLAALQAIQVDQLLDRVLSGTGIIFSDVQREGIKRLTGLHPYLVQMAGAILFDAIVSGTNQPVHESDIRQALQRAAGDHFEHLWRYLAPDAQRVLFILAGVDLPKLNQKVAGARALERYMSELNPLAYRGLIERTTSQQGALWRGERWCVSALAFTHWILDNHTWEELAPPAHHPAPRPAERADRIQELQKQIAAKRRRLNVLEQKAATLGISTPAEINIEIEDIKQDIERGEREMRKLSRPMRRV